MPNDKCCSPAVLRFGPDGITKIVIPEAMGCTTTEDLFGLIRVYRRDNGGANFTLVIENAAGRTRFEGAAYEHPALSPKDHQQDTFDVVLAPP